MILFLIFIPLTYLSNVDSTDLKTSETEHTTKNLDFLVTTKKEIWRVQENGNSYRYDTSASAISDVDYHLEKNILFWVDIERQEIHSQPLNVNSVVPHNTFKQKNWSPIALAVDFVSDKLYVADILGVKIDVFELNGKHHGIVFGTNLVRPTDIKVDPYECLIFILDGFRIVRVNMDGSSASSFVAEGITIFHGIFIDTTDKKIYWSKKKDFEIVSSNYFGKNVNASGNNSLSSLIWSKFTIFNGNIFWASNLVHYKSKCSNQQMSSKTIYQSNPVPTIKALHFSLQNSILNPCDKDNGGCQHMCILTSKINNTNNFTYRCACSVGWTLDVNLMNCTYVADFLIYAQSTIIKSHLIENCKNIFCEPYLPIAESKSKFIDFDYRSADNFFYYIVKNKIKNDVIYKVHPNESEPEIFLLGEHENYQSLALDSINTSLYFTDSIKGTITVVNTNNKFENKILLENLNQPEDIILHSKKNLLFFFQTNETTKITIFSKVRTDGSNLILFNDIPLRKMCGFSIDFIEDKIYWYEWRKDYIRYSDLDLNKVQIVRSMLTKYLYSIFIYEKWIYFATIDSEGLWRMDKKTGKESELILADLANRITKVKVFGNKAFKAN